LPKDFSIKVVPPYPIKLGRFKAQMGPNLRRGLNRAGAVLEGGWKQMISGPGFVRNPQRTSKYYGVLSGAAILKINHVVSKDGLEVRIGPPGGKIGKYIAVQEHGATIQVTKKMRGFLHYKDIHLKKSTTRITIPKRAVRPDLWRKKGKIAIRAIRNAITRPLR
jgi:hypothetical protein